VLVGSGESAPVVVNGSEIFEVIGIRAFSAKRRANLIAERIEKLAADPAFDPATLRVEHNEGRSEIFAGDDPVSIMLVLDVDAEYQGAGAPREIVADVQRKLIQDSIEQYRHDRTAGVIRDSIIQATLRTAALGVVLFIVMWTFRRLDVLLGRQFKRRIKKLEAKSMRVVQAEQIWKVFSGVLTLFKTLLVLFIVYLFLNAVLSLFPWTRHFARTLLHLILDPLQAMGSALLGYMPNFVFLLLLYFITRYLLNLVHGLFDAIHRENLRFARFEAEWAWPTYRIIRVVVIIFAVIVAYPYIPGSESDAFKGISLFVGVLLSLGSTSFISNIIAGYTMTYRGAFKIGDRVRIGDTVGDVIESRLLVTQLRSLKNERIVIPNSTILNSEVTNYSSLAREEGVILHTRVGIGYEVPWRQVEAMLLEAAARTEGLREEPAPFVLQVALTDFAVTYELNAYAWRSTTPGCIAISRTSSTSTACRS